jgi:2-methylaconitate isomerase
MRGGTSKGLFLHEADLPRRSEARDRLLLRIMGSPDPYESQMDGMGGGSASTSKIVIVGLGKRSDCDIEVLFGELSSRDAHIDYHSNGGELNSAVGVFAIHEGLVKPQDGITKVRIWLANLNQRVDASIPVQQGRVLELGAFQQEGVPFKSAEIRLEFYEPEPSDETPLLLPTGQPSDDLKVPGLGKLRVTMIGAGHPTVFVRADALELTGKETPESFNRSHAKLKLLESIRVQAASVMGLAGTPAQGTQSLTTSPVIAWVAKPQSYRSGVGLEVAGEQIDVIARMLLLGKLHPGYSGAASIALAAAAALPGSVVNEITRTLPGVATRIGHASGTLAVGAEVSQTAGVWRMEKTVLSGSARRLMSGQVYWPEEYLR